MDTEIYLDDKKLMVAEATIKMNPGLPTIIQASFLLSIDDSIEIDTSKEPAPDLLVNAQAGKSIDVAEDK